MTPPSPPGCSACTEPVDLAQPHIAHVRNVESEDQLGNVTVHDATVLSRQHLTCPASEEPTCLP